MPRCSEFGISTIIFGSLLGRVYLVFFLRSSDGGSSDGLKIIEEREEEKEDRVWKACHRVKGKGGEFRELRKLRGVLHSPAVGGKRSARAHPHLVSCTRGEGIRASRRLVNVHVVKRFDNTLHLRPSERTELDLDQPLETAKLYPFRVFHHFSTVSLKKRKKEITR